VSIETPSKMASMLMGWSMLGTCCVSTCCVSVEDTTCMTLENCDTRDAPLLSDWSSAAAAGHCSGCSVVLKF
jgi:hypothetical protein